MKPSIALAFCAISCTEASLYGVSGAAAPEVNRLTVQSDRICASTADAVGFPTKVVLLLDTSSAVRATAVAAFDATARTLTPPGFVNGADVSGVAGKLTAALGASGTTQPDGRDYGGALSLARSIIEGDLAATPAGVRQRTRYVIALLGAGEARRRLLASLRINREAREGASTLALAALFFHHRARGARRGSIRETPLFFFGGLLQLS